MKMNDSKSKECLPTLYGTLLTGDVHLYYTVERWRHHKEAYLHDCIILQSFHAWAPNIQLLVRARLCVFVNYSRLKHDCDHMATLTGEGGHAPVERPAHVKFIASEDQRQHHAFAQI